MVVNSDKSWEILVFFHGFGIIQRVGVLLSCSQDELDGLAFLNVVSRQYCTRFKLFQVQPFIAHRALGWSRRWIFSEFTLFHVLQQTGKTENVPTICYLCCLDSLLSVVGVETDRADHGVAFTYRHVDLLGELPIFQARPIHFFDLSRSDFWWRNNEAELHFKIEFSFVIHWHVFCFFRSRFRFLVFRCLKP